MRCSLIVITLPEIGDYTIKEFIYGVQDTTAVVRGTRIACEIIAVSNPGYVVYTIYDIVSGRDVSIHTRRGNWPIKGKLALYKPLLHCNNHLNTGKKAEGYSYEGGCG